TGPFSTSSTCTDTSSFAERPVSPSLTTSVQTTASTRTLATTSASFFFSSNSRLNASGLIGAAVAGRVTPPSASLPPPAASAPARPPAPTHTSERIADLLRHRCRGTTRSLRIAYGFDTAAVGRHGLRTFSSIRRTGFSLHWSRSPPPATRDDAMHFGLYAEL